MKKVFVIFIGCLFFNPVMGASMCADSGVYVAVLNPERDGVSSSVDTENGTFTVTFDYMTARSGSATTNNVLGVVSCNDIVGIQNSTSGGISGSVLDTGTNCWCAISKPMMTRFAFTGVTYNTAAECAASCVSVCAARVSTVAAFRTAIYNDIAW